jgi:hypothetical protein
MIYNNLFLADLDVMAVESMPTKWRKPIHIAFVRLLIYPFKLQLERLRTERTRNIYQLEHDSRVGKVEKVLNDRFDFSERRIRIGLGDRIQSLYLYTEAEAQQTYLPKIVYTQAEIAARNTDFTILIPAAVTIVDQELEILNYLVKNYTSKDKSFKIEIV